MVINKSGITIRIGVDTLREMGRATQGVKIIKLRENDSIASVAKVSRFQDHETTENNKEQENTLETNETKINNEENDINNEKE